MATTATTSLGPNSWVISFARGATIAQLMSDVTAVLVGAGWEVYDSAAGTNKIVYRAQNLDAQTYKYMMLDYNATSWLYITAYEAWNATTHTGTNAVTTYDQSVYQQILTPSTDKGLIYIFANRRYAAFIIRQYSSSVLGNNSMCGSTGVYEFSRDNPDDTVAAGYPIHCQITTGIVGEGVNGNYPSLYLPRGRVNQYGEISTVFGRTYYGNNFYLKDLLPNATNIFSNKDWAISMYVQEGTPANPSVRGRLYGMKAFTLSKLFFMDKIQVPCDENLNYDPNGVMTDHYVIPAGRQGAGTYTVRMLIPA